MSNKINDAKIIYTKVDEAPALASYSLLPIIKAFTDVAGVKVETRDISLAGRILANFPEKLTDEQKIPNDLNELAKLVTKPEANIIKLPCISASIPQLKGAIKELQDKGFNIPDFPEEPENDEEIEIRAKYDKVKGSAVNPVLREGNSDRRIPISVKNYARKNPHKMGQWEPDSKSQVAHMQCGDLCSNEKTITISEETIGKVKIEFEDKNGNVKVLKEDINLIDGEIIDGTYMSRHCLRTYLEELMKEAKELDILFSVHLKATMMKVSDPIIFGHVVSVYFKRVFKKYADTFTKLGVDPNNGLGDLYEKIKELPEEERKAIEADIEKTYTYQPKLAMVDSEKGITNLHVPSDIIIDASMPAAIRNSGKMWGPDGKPHDTMFMIPCSSYAGIYDEVIEFCKIHGAFDPSTMGNVPNVGLMAQKAQEYGSHDKTFLCPDDGKVRIISDDGKTMIEHEIEKGDIWRMTQVKDLPIQDWVKLAVNRARITDTPAVFWLDKQRSHDRHMIKKVNKYLKDHNTVGLEIHIMSPVEAIRYSMDRMRTGKDTISVTGNVLRDYLTDLFPILEVGTSAKILSVVPLMNGGGLFETGAGGSAPKHVRQFLYENHLRWDSLGEFLAIAASLEHLSIVADNKEAHILSETLDKATEKFLLENKSPSRIVNELDNRGSHFYLTMYWAEELAEQSDDPALQKRFTKLAKELTKNQDKIVDELNRVQGKAVDIGGYYLPDDKMAAKIMRPSVTFNSAIESFIKA